MTALWLVFAALLIGGAWLAFEFLRAPLFPAQPPTFDEPRARRPLRVDTTTGSHDDLPIRDDVRQMLTDYVEGMWRHTQEMP